MVKFKDLEKEFKRSIFFTNNGDEFKSLKTARKYYRDYKSYNSYIYLYTIQDNKVVELTFSRTMSRFIARNEFEIDNDDTANCDVKYIDRFDRYPSIYICNQSSVKVSNSLKKILDGVKLQNKLVDIAVYNPNALYCVESNIDMTYEQVYHYYTKFAKFRYLKCFNNEIVKESYNLIDMQTGLSTGFEVEYEFLYGNNPLKQNEDISVNGVNYTVSFIRHKWVNEYTRDSIKNSPMVEFGSLFDACLMYRYINISGDISEIPYRFIKRNENII